MPFGEALGAELRACVQAEGFDLDRPYTSKKEMTLGIREIDESFVGSRLPADLQAALLENFRLAHQRYHRKR